MEVQNLQIVINRFESRFLETVNEDVIAKALGRPVLWKIPDDQDAARALQHGDTGLPETRISRISLEMASSITGHPIPQEKKNGFWPQGSRSKRCASGFRQSMNRQARRFRLRWNARRTPTITWPTPDPITYGDKLTFAQLNATASVEGTLVYTPGPGYVLPVGTHTLWVTFTPEDTGSYRPAAGRNFNCRRQGNAGPQLAEHLPRSSTAPNWTMRNSTLGAGAGKIRLLSRAGRSAPAWNAHALGDLHSRGQRELHHNTGHRDPDCGQGNVCHSVAAAGSDYIRHKAQQRRNSVPRRRFREHSNTTPAQERCLRPESIRLSVVFTPADTLGHSASQASVSLTVTKATPAVTWPKPDPIAPRRSAQRHPAKCHSNRARVICLYACCGRNTRARSA